MALSKTAYVILGLLRMGCRTGYEIKSLVDVSTRFFWAASYGQIYPELKRLEQAGLIRVTAERAGAPGGGRRRKAYELTGAGDEALRDWLTSGSPLHFELRHEGVLRFFLSDAVGVDERVELLRSIRSEHERILGELSSIRPRAEADRLERRLDMPLMTLDFGIAYQRFIVDWCSELERRLQAGSSATAGGAG
jgi:DNA-binding PadR family transcriptional regulator